MQLYTNVILNLQDGSFEYSNLTPASYTADIEYAGSGGGSGGGQQSTTTVEKSDPWGPQQPYLTTGFSRAQTDVLNNPRQFYPNSTVVDFSPETQASLDLTSQRALLGSPLVGAAQNELTSTLGGDYLYGGDGFNAAVDAASRRVLPGVDSQFALGGRYGSGLAQEAQARAVGDIFANQYQQERTNQLRGMLFAPQLAEQDYTDFGKLAAVGAQKESLEQERIAEDIARHDFSQMEQQNRLADYMNLIQGTYGGTSSSTSTQPMYRNSGSSMLGGALGGAQLASGIFGPAAGLGTLGGGALLGGLLGGFF